MWLAKKKLGLKKTSSLYASRLWTVYVSKLREVKEMLSFVVALQFISREQSYFFVCVCARLQCQIAANSYYVTMLSTFFVRVVNIIAQLGLFPAEQSWLCTCYRNQTLNRIFTFIGTRRQHSKKQKQIRSLDCRPTFVVTSLCLGPWWHDMKTETINQRCDLYFYNLRKQENCA